jgi:LCP family protein required for cell wall assembly
VSHITEPRPSSDDLFSHFLVNEPVRRGPRRWVLVLVGLLVLLAAASAGGVILVRHQLSVYNSNIQRFGDPFTKLAASARPPVAANHSMNLLLLGSDSRISAGDPSQWVAGAQRTDAIMLVHIPADRSGAFVISIPRDSWVDVPGHGLNKINAGFSFGGPALMVQTVEKITDVRIDHIVIADFEGFKALTDLLGGVTITVPKTTRDSRAAFSAGTYRMDGTTALNYVRQRHNLPGGDFDREKRQQNWIRAVLKEMVSKGTLTDPIKVNAVLDEMTKSIETDDNFTLSQMRDLAFSLRGLRSHDVAFLTAPVAGTGREGKQDVVYLDTHADAALWKAAAGDQMIPWLTEHQPALLSDTVR